MLKEAIRFISEAVLKCIADVRCYLPALTEQTASAQQMVHIMLTMSSKIHVMPDFEVDRTADDEKQTLICQSNWNFNVALRPCVADPVQCPAFASSSNQKADKDGP
jgi:hypothetical protein